MLRAIFVVGTGRSGTHFTCRALNGFKNTFDPLGGFEERILLRDIATSAIHHQELPKSAHQYYLNCARTLVPGQVFIDQHHPNLFFSHAIRKYFPESIFLYPDRPLEQIVASMMRHNGVMSWYRYAQRVNRPWSFKKSIPYPNQFLGLQSNKEISALPVHLLCAYRALNHKLQFLSLAQTDARYRLVRYEDLINDQKHTLTTIFTEQELRFLGPFEISETPRLHSLNKYSETLNELELKDLAQLEIELLKSKQE